MALRIDYQSESFPSSFSVPRFGILSTSWDEVLWAAITIGRPSTYHVLRHGPASFHEAIFRLSLIRMAVEQDAFGRLTRTNAFKVLDPTEKGMVTYFLGMTFCKLFSTRLLNTPWLLHLDLFRLSLNATLLGRSRPDLIGENNVGDWYAFESKGRASVPSTEDKTKAKSQAQRLVSVMGNPCTLHIGSLTFFKSDELRYHWKDPEPDVDAPIELPRPTEEWRYYFEPAMSLAASRAEDASALDFKQADITVEIHPKIESLLTEGLWNSARDVAKELGEELKAGGYQPDGIKVIAGPSWSEITK